MISRRGLGMKTVLLIDYFFPPLAADWRGIAFARFMPEFGWRPIVLSAADTVRYEKDYDLLREIPAETEVHRVGHAENNRFCRFISTKLKIQAGFPDPYGKWIEPAYRVAREVLRREKIDLLYSHSPCFSTAMLALRLKREFKLPWIADFLDAWSGNDYLNAFYDQTLREPFLSFQRRRIRKAEGDVLRTADRVVVIHRSLRGQFAEAHGLDEAKIQFISDGYFESDFADLKPRPLYADRLTIMFLGGTYGGFQEILSKFCKVVAELRADAEIVFIGRGARSLQWSNLANVTLISHLPRRKALGFGLGADFLLLAAVPSARWHTPTKIYDYLRLGRPILALVSEDGDPARTIREAKAGFILS